MMNYMKSELYRVFHDKGVYCFTGALSLLSILLNALLGWCGKVEGASFSYNTTSFSFSNLVANPMLFCVMGSLIGITLYEGNRKNGTLKNTIAFGIPRLIIFAGECIVTTVTAAASLIIVLGTYIISALLFLESTGPVNLTDLLTEIPAVFLIAVASLISGIVCIEVFGKSSSGIIVWFLIWFIIPEGFYYLGLRFDAAHKIAMWMPDNYFGTNAMIVNQSTSITAWGTSAGMTKCVITGIIGILVFSIWGMVTLRKKEL